MRAQRELGYDSVSLVESNESVRNFMFHRIPRLEGLSKQQDYSDRNHSDYLAGQEWKRYMQKYILPSFSAKPSGLILWTRK